MTFSFALAQALQPITVGVMVPLSGSQAKQGQEIYNAASVAVSLTRAKFKVLGLDLRIKAYDDQNSAVQVKALLGSIIADVNVMGLVGPLSSEVARIAVLGLEEARIPMVSPAAGLPRLGRAGDGNFNRLVAGDDLQAQAGVIFIKTTLNARSLFVLDDGSQDGQAQTRGVVQEAAKQGLKVLGNVTVDQSMSLKDLLRQISQAKPDVLYYNGGYDFAIPLLKRMRRDGDTTLFFGGDALSNDGFRKEVGAAGAGIYYTSSAAPPLAYSQARDFVSAYKTQFKMEPTSNALLGYDACLSLLKAIENLKTNAPQRAITRPRVLEALRSVEASGLTGTIRFNVQGDRQDPPVFILTLGNDLGVRISTIAKAGARE